MQKEFIEERIDRLYRLSRKLKKASERGNGPINQIRFRWCARQVRDALEEMHGLVDQTYYLAELNSDFEP